MAGFAGIRNIYGIVKGGVQRFVALAKMDGAPPRSGEKSFAGDSHVQLFTMFGVCVIREFLCVVCTRSSFPRGDKPRCCVNK